MRITQPPHNIVRNTHDYLKQLVYYSNQTNLSLHPDDCGEDWIKSWESYIYSLGFVKILDDKEANHNDICITLVTRPFVGIQIGVVSCIEKEIGVLVYLLEGEILSKSRAFIWYSNANIDLVYILKDANRVCI